MGTGQPSPCLCQLRTEVSQREQLGTEAGSYNGVSGTYWCHWRSGPEAPCRNVSLLRVPDRLEHCREGFQAKMHASEAVENIEFERSAALFLRRVASPSPGTFSLGVRYLDTTQRRPPGSLSARTAQNLDWRPATRQPECQIFARSPKLRTSGSWRVDSKLFPGV